MASSKKDSFRVAKDTKGNVYFIESGGGCESYVCEPNAPNWRKLSVLTKDSLKEENPKPRIIHGVIDNDEKITDFKVNDRDELEIHFESKTVAVVRNAGLANETFPELNHGPLKILYEIQHAGENDTIVALRSQVVPLPQEIVESQLYEDLRPIKFDPEFPGYMHQKMVVDKNGNFWILPTSSLVYPGQERKKPLYFMEKGTDTTKIVFKYENLLDIWTSKAGEVFVTSDSGMFFSPTVNKKLNCSNSSRETD